MYNKKILLLLATLFVFQAYVCGQTKKSVPPVAHPDIGTQATSNDGKLKIRLIGKKQNYGGSAETRDEAIHSPKSVNVHPSGKKFYVNSLEGGTTVVYDMDGFKRLKIISHHINESHATLWGEPSSLYPFTHYPQNNTFMGKPVEATFSHGGRYLWVPYYRRSYDINAQDPSAVAIIDTESDEIVRLMETGPLPKMIATSHDGKTIAISHWGNNTVGLIDVSSSDPMEWKHKSCLVVDYVLPLHYSLTVSCDRDNGSGYALRGTVFTPDDHYLLVGCMGGGGGIAVIDLQTGKYYGRVLGMMSNVRHLVIRDGWLYLSINGGGYVQRIRLEKFHEALSSINGKTTYVSGWESCKVGTGARTIELSPSGRYVFAACNNASQVCIVDTRQMKQVASISCDSYPVGLDISKDGRYVFVTSQGRADRGGNAVNIYEVEYAEPEKSTDENYTINTDESNTEDIATDTDVAEQDWLVPCLAGGGLLLLSAGITLMIIKHNKNA